MHVCVDACRCMLAFVSECVIVLLYMCVILILLYLFCFLLRPLGRAAISIQKRFTKWEPQ